MRRFIFIVLMSLVTAIAISQVVALKLKLKNGNVVAVPHETIKKMNFATFVETPVLKCKKISTNSYLISWDKVENTSGYRWMLDRGKPIETTDTFVELNNLQAGNHEFNLVAISGGDFFVDSHEGIQFLKVTIEDVIFAQHDNVIEYYNNVFKGLPYEASYQNSSSGVCNDALFNTVAGDEVQFVGVGRWLTKLKNDNYTESDLDVYTNWLSKYDKIREAGIFIDKIEEVTGFSRNEVVEMAASMRVVRAFCYFQIFRRYGPGMILKSESDPSYWAKPERSTVDEFVEFMLADLDKAIPDLPEKSQNTEVFEKSITKGAAMALKSRILLYAASPLFNGCELYKGQMVNQSGKYIFPQTYDGEKWEKAAQAAKAVIDMNLYSLQQKTGGADAIVDAIDSYQSIQFDAFNDETIWGYWPRVDNNNNDDMSVAKYNRSKMLPVGIGEGCYYLSMKLFDSYPMQATGRYPINPVSATEYDGLNPQIDPQSGFKIDGFEEGWMHPVEGSKLGSVKAHNSCVGRDARFYASVLANGFRFYNDKTSLGNVIITFYRGGTSFKSSGSGFLIRRFVPNEINPDNDYYGNYFWWYFRLGEIYLNYAEACNEKPSRDAAEALKYLNMIRHRAGLNTIEEAYPEYDFMNDQDALRQIIRQERMIELAFEGHRYYDVRRWLTAAKELNGNECILMAGDITNRSDYENSWKRKVIRNNKFSDRSYFLPIPTYVINSYSGFNQNYGW